MSESIAASYGRCRACGYLMFPIPDLAPCGHDAGVDEAPLNEPGVVFSWTRTHVGGPAVLMVMADFFGGDVRVTAPLVGRPSVKIGDPVRVRAGEDLPYHLEPVA